MVTPETTLKRLQSFKMLETNARGILLDIEGTTSSISFVYDVMFPYVRENVASFLAANWKDEAVQACLPLLAEDLDQESAEAWLGDSRSGRDRIDGCRRKSDWAEETSGPRLERWFYEPANGGSSLR